MTYGKANPPSRYMRTHPYRRQPCGSARPDEEEVCIGDVWKVIKKYVVSSVSQLVQKITGQTTEKKDDSTTSLGRIDGDALRDSPNNSYPNQQNNDVFATRQRMGWRETDPRGQMWMPRRPFTPHQSHYPYIGNRPQGLPYRPMNTRGNPTMSYISPRVVKPYPYRRTWTSTVKSHARISRLSNSNPINRFRRVIGPSSNQRPSLNREIDATSLRRKLFSWEKYRSKMEYKHEEKSQGESKMKLTYTDPSIRRAIERAEQSSGGKIGSKNGLIPKRSFAARLNRSASKDKTHKRKTYRSFEPGLKLKQPRNLGIPQKSAMDITVSKCNDVDSVPRNRSEPNSDVSMESEQKDASCSDKIVGDIEVEEAPKLTSSDNVPVSPIKVEQSSSLFAPISNTIKPASSGIFVSNNETKESGLFDNVQSKKTLTPASSSSGLFSHPEKKDQAKVTPSTNLFCPSEKKVSKKITPVSAVKAKLAEDNVMEVKPKAKLKIEKKSETDCKLVSTNTTASSQKPSEPAVDESISFACRLGRLKRIKIRDHYIHKIESLYDSNCTEKDKDAKKSKAVSIYKEKYHKLRQDHSFYTKLCKQYDVEPGEEYIGVDPDIKPDEDEAEDKKKTMPEPFSFKPKVDLESKVDSKPMVDLKPVVNKPHINPFAPETTKPAEEPAKKGFNFSGSIFSTGPPKPHKRKRSIEDSPSTNLFNVPKKPNLFTGNSITTPAVTNPFSPAATAIAGSSGTSLFSSSPGNAKNNLFNTTNGALKATGGLFGSTSTNTSNGGGMASMDSDVPSGNSAFSSANPFASKPGQTSNTNLFASSTTASNPFNMNQSGSSGPFGNAQSNTNPFTTNSSGGPFRNQGAFNPGNVGRGFSLGNIAGNAGKNKKRRTVVRGRRTLL